MKYNNIIINTIKHFNLVNKHRFVVFKLCVLAGIPFRGLVHDLSKYSPTEFFEGVKYYNGRMSPIILAKRKKGYSRAWLHHKGRNKHHAEYWYDPRSRNKTPMIPYKYTVELICDNLAAGIIYKGKKWKKDTQIAYWYKSKKELPINSKNDKMITEVFTLVSLYGINKVITRKNLKRLYKKYCK